MSDLFFFFIHAYGFIFLPAWITASVVTSYTAYIALRIDTRCPEHAMLKTMSLWIRLCNHTSYIHTYNTMPRRSMMFDISHV